MGKGLDLRRVLFRSRTNRPPIPSEMVHQVLSGTNLICYDWELTEPRMRDLLYIGQLFRVLLAKAQIPPESKAIAWFQAAAPKLGNCVSSIALLNPTKLSLSRESSFGFTAVELHLIGDWLESPSFPLGLHALLAPNLVPSVKKYGTNVLQHATP